MRQTRVRRRPARRPSDETAGAAAQPVPVARLSAASAALDAALVVLAAIDDLLD